MFESFRRHQKKWLALLALMAMFAFTLDFSLFRNNSPGARQNPVVFQLAGKDVRVQDLDEFRIGRVRANHFMQTLGARTPEFFGGTTDGEIRQAMIVSREADRLGIPATTEIANTWLRSSFPNITTEQMDMAYRSQFTEGSLSCTDEQLLLDIAEQLRVNQIYMLIQAPQRTTPLDLFRAYRDQNERVSATIVPFPVDRYIGEIADPTDAQVQAYYDKYKNQLPDPASDTPGFMLPRRVQVEYVQVDSSDRQQSLRESMTTEDLRAYYKAHEKELTPPPRELPLNLFADDPENKLTPHTNDPFEEMKETIRTAASEAKAREEIDRQFAQIRDDVMSPFLSKYEQVAADNAELAEQAAAAGKPAGSPAELPRARSETGESLLKAAAEKAGLEYQETPLMSHDEAEKRVPISGASLGSRRIGGGRSFVDALFNAKGGLYEPVELADPRGLRFLAWKTEDMVPEVPALATIRDEVVHAWKEEQARSLAERDAQALAEKAREAKGDLRSVSGDLPLTLTSEVAQFTQAIDPRSFTGFGQLRPSEVPELTLPSDALRDAVFTIKPGEVKVEPNAPKTVYYVVAYGHRTPANLDLLYSPIGARTQIEPMLEMTGRQGHARAWLTRLEESSKATPLVESRRGGSNRASSHDHEGESGEF